MTTKEKIEQIQKERYGDYKGRMQIGLGMLHAMIRAQIGDKKFLEFLEESEIKNPKPTFKFYNPCE